MTYVVASVAVVLLFMGLRVFRVLPTSSRAISLSREAAHTLWRDDLPEKAKEHAIRSASLGLLRCFVSSDADRFALSS